MKTRISKIKILIWKFIPISHATITKKLKRFSAPESLKFLKLLRVLGDRVVFTVLSDRSLSRILRDKVFFRIHSNTVFLRILNDSVPLVSSLIGSSLKFPVIQSSLGSSVIDSSSGSSFIVLSLGYSVLFFRYVAIFIEKTCYFFIKNRRSVLRCVFKKNFTLNH